MALCACVQQQGSAPAPGGDAVNPRLPIAAQRTVSDIVGRTLMHFDEVHGTQLEYYDEQGLSYLWYPNNPEILISHYRLRPRSGDICFIYGHFVYDHERRESGGDEWCHRNDDFWAHVRESVPGDPFGLQTRIAVPFVLDAAPTTIEALRAASG